MKRFLSADAITSLLVFLFTYAALRKAFWLTAAEAVFRQAMPKTGAAVIAPLIPTSEAFIVLLLLFKRTRLTCLYASALLPCVFTVYLVYMLLAVPDLPFSCGGVISAMTWKQHLLFNLLLIGLTIVAIRRLKVMTDL